MIIGYIDKSIRLSPAVQWKGDNLKEVASLLSRLKIRTANIFRDNDDDNVLVIVDFSTDGIGLYCHRHVLQADDWLVLDNRLGLEDEVIALSSEEFGRYFVES